MPTVYLAPTFGAGYQAFTSGGLPLNAGLIYTYAAGGTTPTATYTTSAGNVANANPIVLATDGRTPSEVWLIQGTAYRFDVKDSDGNLIKTYDNLYGIGDPLAANVAKPYYVLSSVSGTNTITASAGNIISALAVGQLFVFVPANTNTGATTLEITGTASLGAKNLFIGGAACVGGEIISGVPVLVEWDGTQLNIIGPYVGGNLPTGQIKFPATQNASSDANTLDDYEEGTWTPIIVSAGGGTATYLLQAGTYVKKGIEVTAHYNLTVNSKAGLSAGQTSVGGFPFTCQNSSGARGAGAVAWDTLATSVYTVVLLVTNNSTSFALKTIAAAAVSIGNITVADLANGSGFNGSVTYPATA